MRLIFSPSSRFCIVGKNNKMKKKQPKLSDKVREFNKLVQEFMENYQKYESHMCTSIRKYRNLDHLAWFARSVLICNKQVNVEDSFRTIKMNLLRQEGKLTPHSCTLLMESLVHFKFQGDENGILGKLCNYYDKMGFLFSYQEQQSFWKNYIRVMGKKAHSTVKFKNLARRNQQIYESVPNFHKYFIEKLKQNDLLKENPQFTDVLRKANYLNNEIYLHFPQGKLRIKGVSIFNRVHNIDEIEKNMFLGLERNNEFGEFLEDDSTFAKQIPNIINQIFQINKALRKGWKVIIHGKIILVNNSRSFLKTGPLSLQILQKLKQTVYYQEGICFNIQNPRQRKILHIQTLLLAINPQFYTQGMVYFCQKEAQKQKETVKYFSLKNLQLIREHADICGFHWRLLENYNFISHWKSLEYVKEVKKDLEISDFEEQIREKINMQQGEDKNTLLKGESEQLAALALKRYKQIGYFKLETDYYEKGWHLQSFNDLVRYTHWSLSYLFTDTQKIYHIFNQLCHQSSEDKEKKILLVTDNRDSLQVLIHLIEGKFLEERPKKEDFDDIKLMILKKLQRPFEQKSFPRQKMNEGERKR